MLLSQATRARAQGYKASLQEVGKSSTWYLQNKKLQYIGIDQRPEFLCGNAVGRGGGAAQVGWGGWQAGVCGNRHAWHVVL